MQAVVVTECTTGVTTDRPSVPRRKYVRLRGHDHATPDEYLVTICTAGREEFFGQGEDAAIKLNGAGQIA